MNCLFANYVPRLGYSLLVVKECFIFFIHKWNGVEYPLWVVEMFLCVLMYIPTIPLIYESRSYGFSVCLGKKHFFCWFLSVRENENVLSVIFLCNFFLLYNCQANLKIYGLNHFLHERVFSLHLWRTKIKFW